MWARDDFIPTAVRPYYFIIIGLGLSPGSIMGIKKKKVMISNASQVPILNYVQ